MVRKVKNIEQEIRNAILLFQGTVDRSNADMSSKYMGFILASNVFGFACANMEDVIRRSIKRIASHIENIQSK